MPGHSKPFPRIVEAYVGEYASGKSENAVNRALALVENGHQVVLADLDLVEPFYTLKPLKKKLHRLGLTIIAWNTGETIGLGETGCILKPDMRWVLKRQESAVILDVGYDIEGAKVLNLIEGAWTDPDLKIYAVINVARPLNASVSLIVEYIRNLGRIDGLINNTHLGNKTEADFIQEGAKIVTEAAKLLNIPVVATAVLEELVPLIGSHDCLGNPVRVLRRFMPETFW